MIKYADRMKNSEPSIIREMLKLSSNPSYISFAGGDPDPALFPMEELKKSCLDVFESGDVNLLQYGLSEGNTELRKSIAELMNQSGIPTGIDNIIITSGSQQGLDLAARLFLNEGDGVVVERPSYMGAINAFKLCRPEFVQVDMDEDGMRVDLLESILLKKKNIKLIYTIPDFQNPTGRSMSEKRRRDLAALAEKHNVIILEDSPYYYLRYEGADIPPVKYFDKYGRVVYLGSTSKMLCPALRVGWICAEEDMIKQFVIVKQAADIHSNEISQLQVSAYLNSGKLKEHLSVINSAYRRKRDAMLEAVKDLLPSEIKHTQPAGGLFIWLTLPDSWNGEEIMELCIKERVAVIPGGAFFTENPLKNTLRLSFATMEPEEIRVGIERIGRAMKKLSAAR